MDKEKTLFLKALATAWAITPEMLSIILAVAAGEQEIPEALQMKPAARLENTRSMRVRDNVAILPILGPIFPRANLFTEISGATSLNSLAMDLGEAARNPAIDAIILEIDSPGGALPGIEDFAKEVAAVNRQKPVAAFVYHEACSAAMWIASACREIVLGETGIVGSIGVVLGMRRPDDPQSSRNVEFVSSVSPKKRPDISTDAGRIQIQDFVDQLGLVFVETLAQNRGIKPEDVIAIGGGLLIGKKAIDGKLADRIGTFEDLVSELQTSARGKGYQSISASASTQEQPTMNKLIAWLKSWGKPEAAKAPDDATPEEKELIAAMDAKLIEQRLEGFKAIAKAYATGLFAQGKVLPYAIADVEAAYLHALRDDAALPVASGEKSRVALLEAQYAAVKASVMTAEVVVDDKTPTTKIASKQGDGKDEALEAEDRQNRDWIKKTNARRA